MAIDNPYDAIEQQYKDQSDPLFEKTMEVFSKVDRFIGFVNFIRKQFSSDATIARIKALVDQLVIDINVHEKQMGKTIEITQSMETAEFAETMLAAINETARTTDHEKIKRFAAILGYSLVSDKKANWDDAAAHIRDVAQLGERDIEALKILYSIQKDLFLGKHLPLDANSYTAKNDEVLRLADESGMPRDEFYSRCSRLNGFGLAIEVQRNPGRVAPNDHCFRLTTRGRELISMLSG